MDIVQELNNAIHRDRITWTNSRTHRTHLTDTLLSTLWGDPAMEEETSDTRPHFSPVTTEVFLRENNVDLIVRAHEAATHGAVFLHNRRVLTLFSSSNYERDFNFGSMALFRYAPPSLVASALPDIIPDTTEEHSMHTTSLTSHSFPAVPPGYSQAFSMHTQSSHPPVSPSHLPPLAAATRWFLPMCSPAYVGSTARIYTTLSNFAAERTRSTEFSPIAESAEQATCYTPVAKELYKSILSPIALLPLLHPSYTQNSPTALTHTQCTQEDMNGLAAALPDPLAHILLPAPQLTAHFLLLEPRTRPPTTTPYEDYRDALPPLNT